MNVELPVLIERQPDYTTCGPTALHAIYHYYGDPIDLQTVIAETPKLPGGGTLSVHLAVHALTRGYDVDTWIAFAMWIRPGFSNRPTYSRSSRRAPRRRDSLETLVTVPRSTPSAST